MQMKPQLSQKNPAYRRKKHEPTDAENPTVAKKPLQLARKTPIAVTVAGNPSYQCNKLHPHTHGMDTYWWDTCWWDTYWWNASSMAMCGICVV